MGLQVEFHLVTHTLQLQIIMCMQDYIFSSFVITVLLMKTATVIQITISGGVGDFVTQSITWIGGIFINVVLPFNQVTLTIFGVSWMVRRLVLEISLRLIPIGRPPIWVVPVGAKIEEERKSSHTVTRGMVLGSVRTHKPVVDKTMSLVACHSEIVTQLVVNFRIFMLFANTIHSHKIL